VKLYKPIFTANFYADFYYDHQLSKMRQSFGDKFLAVVYNFACFPANDIKSWLVATGNRVLACGNNTIWTLKPGHQTSISIHLYSTDNHSNPCYTKQLLIQLYCTNGQHGMLHKTFFNPTSKIGATILQVFNQFQKTPATHCSNKMLH